MCIRDRDEQYKIARDLIESNLDIAHAMVKALLEWETIDREQILDIMAGRDPKPPRVYEPINPVPTHSIDSGGSSSGGSTPPPLPAI